MFGGIMGSRSTGVARGARAVLVVRARAALVVRARAALAVRAPAALVIAAPVAAAVLACAGFGGQYGASHPGGDTRSRQGTATPAHASSALRSPAPGSPALGSPALSAGTTDPDSLAPGDSSPAISRAHIRIAISPVGSGMALPGRSARYLIEFSPAGALASGFTVAAGVRPAGIKVTVSCAAKSGKPVRPTAPAAGTGRASAAALSGLILDTLDETGPAANPTAMSSVGTCTASPGASITTTTNPLIRIRIPGATAPRSRIQLAVVATTPALSPSSAASEPVCAAVPVGACRDITTAGLTLQVADRAMPSRPAGPTASVEPTPPAQPTAPPAQGSPPGPAAPAGPSAPSGPAAPSGPPQATLPTPHQPPANPSASPSATGNTGHTRASGTGRSAVRASHADRVRGGYRSGHGTIGRLMGPRPGQRHDSLSPGTRYRALPRGSFGTSPGRRPGMRPGTVLGKLPGSLPGTWPGPLPETSRGSVPRHISPALPLIPPQPVPSSPLPAAGPSASGDQLSGLSGQGEVSVELPAPLGTDSAQIIGLAVALGGALIALLGPFAPVRRRPPPSRRRPADSGGGNVPDLGGAAGPPAVPPGADS